MAAAGKACLFWLMAGFFYAEAAAPPVQKCTLAGTVVDARTGALLERADVVLLSVRGGQRFSAKADAAGRFAFGNLAPGPYRLWAGHSGYVRQEYGSRLAGGAGETLSLAPGEDRRGAVIRLLPKGLISGRVVDEHGKPIANARVEALRAVYTSAGRRLSPAEIVHTGKAGGYRLSDLDPGKYYIAATFQSQEDHYAPTYHPGTVEFSSALPIEVIPGSEIQGIQVPLLRSETFRIRGRVVDALTNRPAAGATVVAMRRNSPGSGPAMNKSSVVQDPEGHFELRDLTPGSYVVTAYLREDGGRYVDRQEVEIADADISGMYLAIAPGVDVTGRIRIEGGGEDGVGRPAILLEARDPLPTGSARARVAEDGTFVIEKLAAGAYSVIVNGVPAGHYLKSVQMGGVDVLDSGLFLPAGGAPGELEVVLGSEGGQVDGVVLNDEQKAASGAQVVLVPGGDRRGRTFLYKTAITGGDGRFHLGDIAPGDYRLYAWEHVEAGMYLDPEFLKLFEGLGEAVSVRDNSRERKQLELIPAERMPLWAAGGGD